MKNKDSKNNLVSGGIAGLLATIPMSIWMMAVHRSLPLHHRYSLPPRKLTNRILKKVGISHKISRKEKKALSLLSHFSYGTAAGSLYGVINQAVPAPPVVKGVGFGLIVWAGSYFGFLPAINLWQKEEEHRKRYWMMAAAHVVWGAFLGLGHEKLQKSPERQVPRQKQFGKASAESVNPDLFMNRYTYLHKVRSE